MTEMNFQQSGTLLAYIYIEAANVQVKSGKVVRNRTLYQGVVIRLENLGAS